jgi:hypothetical protein
LRRASETCPARKFSPDSSLIHQHAVNPRLLQAGSMPRHEPMRYSDTRIFRMFEKLNEDGKAEPDPPGLSSQSVYIYEKVNK